jgi:hypothetical protein
MGQLPLALAATPHPLMEDVRRTYFPAIPGPISVDFVGRGTLAHIESGPATTPRVVVHAILIDPQVPDEVRAFIFKHELLHLELRPRMIGRRLVHHPPEFWEREQELCPERQDVWRWIWGNLGECLRSRPRLERIQVTRDWKRVRDEVRFRFALG